ncbi:hypothetical protein Pcinc_009943 [Petrolisthes cinctipes]|uniref:C2H2-type domain-containing protein n=1 Tax=Petrolisthes cinctipes TaxID=88211 RepID=A0AAE1G417_PETCI|nr:hypothetical protein Pcinc_025903 [Petrolisthes cinctipes]KAK3885882.1 hypothetical protein Pcinc_009943 [Petrolisthes cinctipes]
MVCDCGHACVGELGRWGRRSLPSPPQLVGGVAGMVGAWESPMVSLGDRIRDGCEQRSCVGGGGGGGLGVLLDLLGRGEEEPPLLEDMSSITAPSVGRMCPVCSRFISNPSNLRKHMHRAHGTRTYSCPACPKVYRVACDLRRHTLAAHNIRMDSYSGNGASSPQYSFHQSNSRSGINGAETQGPRERDNSSVPEQVIRTEIPDFTQPCATPTSASIRPYMLAS